MYKILFIILIIGLATPLVTSAFLDGPIVPCGIKNSEDPKLKEDCDFCHLFELLKNIIQFISELIIIIAPVFIVIGGVVILTAGVKPDQAALGKKIILNALIGVAIALLAWTILSMVFNALIGGQGFPWPWNQFHCN